MYRYMKRQNTVFSFLTILFGLILAVYPGHTLKLMVSIIGWGFLVSGVTALIGFATGWRNRQTFGTAAAGLIIGIWSLLMPGFFVSIIPFLVGAVILVSSFISGYHAQKEMDRQHPQRRRSLGMAVLGGAFGLLIMLNPFGSASAVVILAGIGLIYSGVTGLLVGSVLS